MASRKVQEGRQMLVTARMRLVPTTAAVSAAELADHVALAEMLGATIPSNWPPESAGDVMTVFHQRLVAAPQHAAWFPWYGLVTGSGGHADVLAASGGFMGPPVLGVVELGYAVLTQFQGQGHATEMVDALVAWACSHGTLRRIVAEAHADNTPSVRLLKRVGFSAIEAGRQSGWLRYEFVKP